MLQMSKLIRSRDTWRKKAVKRAEQVRELKKAMRRCQNRITELKTQIVELEEQADKKNEITRAGLTDSSARRSLTDLSQAGQSRVLCILLVIQGVVSYRSAPAF